MPAFRVLAQSRPLGSCLRLPAQEAPTEDTTTDCSPSELVAGAPPFRPGALCCLQEAPLP